MEVEKLCVLGAGTMGSQIVQLAAATSYAVSIVDTKDRLIQGGLDAISGASGLGQNQDARLPLDFSWNACFCAAEGSGIGTAQ